MVVFCLLTLDLSLLDIGVCDGNDVMNDVCLVLSFKTSTKGGNSGAAGTGLWDE